MKKFFLILACIGFWGVMIHPVMLIPFGIGVIGINTTDRAASRKR